MYADKFVEKGPTETILDQSLHPYTRLLLQALPTPYPRKRKETLSETVSENGKGVCFFYSQCPFKKEDCKNRSSELSEINGKHYVACHIL